jgi:hypothetical protein
MWSITIKFPLLDKPIRKERRLCGAKSACSIPLDRRYRADGGYGRRSFSVAGAQEGQARHSSQSHGPPCDVRHGMIRVHIIQIVIAAAGLPGMPSPVAQAIEPPPDAADDTSGPRRVTSTTQALRLNNGGLSSCVSSVRLKLE